MKQIIFGLFIVTILGSCTKDFVTTNQDPNQISDVLLKQDFNLVGSPISGMLFNLNGHQIEEDLCQDSWMGFMSTGTDFVGNVNNTTYYIRWNAYWGREYGSVMSPAKQVIQLAEANNLPLFASWAKFIKILSMSKPHLPFTMIKNLTYITSSLNNWIPYKQLLRQTQHTKVLPNLILVITVLSRNG
jgi:hypothetical protein